MKGSNISHTNVSVIIHEAAFRGLDCFQEEGFDFAAFSLIRCPDDLEKIAACASQVNDPVVIVDHNLLEKASRSRVRALCTGAHVPKVVVVLDHDDLVKSKHFILMGCMGVVEKPVSSTTLTRILASLSAGEIWAGRKSLSSIVQSLVWEQNASQLSRREREILDLLGGNLKNREIASALTISEDTLRWHLRNLYSKTMVNSRTQLAHFSRMTNSKFDTSVDQQANSR